MLIGPRAVASNRSRIGLGVMLVCGLLLSACGSGGDVPEPAAKPCAASDKAKPGTSVQDLTVEGVHRKYLIHVPSGYTGATKAPMMFLFHGLDQTGKLITTATSMIRKSDEEGFVLVAPQGRGQTPFWNFREAPKKQGSDLSFIHSLVGRVGNRLCVDEERTYAAGFSNGSALTFALACSHTKDFAAFAGVSGPLSAEKCGTTGQRAIINFHGTSDPKIPFKGAKTLLGPFPGATSAMRSWASHDQCAAPSRQKISKTVERTTWSQCAGTSELIQYVVTGGGHTWPGGIATKKEIETGKTTNDIDATVLIWSFFEEHPKD